MLSTFSSLTLCSFSGNRKQKISLNMSVDKVPMNKLIFLSLQDYFTISSMNDFETRTHTLTLERCCEKRKYTFSLHIINEFFPCFFLLLFLIFFFILWFRMDNMTLSVFFSSTDEQSHCVSALETKQKNRKSILITEM